MVDIHYFIFIVNADTAIFSVLVFVAAYTALRLVYKMWRRNLRCPHCGEIYKPPMPSHEVVDKQLPNTLWT